MRIRKLLLLCSIVLLGCELPESSNSKEDQYDVTTVEGLRQIVSNERYMKAEYPEIAEAGIPKSLFDSAFGDVNGDNIKNYEDAVLIARYSCGIDVAGFDASAADVDGDGNITVVDALIVARYEKDIRQTPYGRLTGVNWFGMEGDGIPSGLRYRDYKSYIKQINDLGFNCVRIPFSNYMFRDQDTQVRIYWEYRLKTEAEPIGFHYYEVKETYDPVYDWFTLEYKFLPDFNDDDYDEDSDIWRCEVYPYTDYILQYDPEMVGETSIIKPDAADPYTGEIGLNTDLEGLNSLEILDKIIEECERNGIMVILDCHSNLRLNFWNETLWYNDGTVVSQDNTLGVKITEEQWIDDWVMLAERYKNQPNVVGYDLKNEVHGNSDAEFSGLPIATWGYDDPGFTNTDWKAAVERCGKAILAVDSDVMIIAEGVQQYGEDSAWWGGNLAGVKDFPITEIPRENLLYSAHEYGETVAAVSWLYEPDFPDNLHDIWMNRFGFILKEGIGPLFIGEFGIAEEYAANENSVDYTWITTFLEQYGHDTSWTFWALNPNSGDTGGILQDDWLTVNSAKYNLIKPYLEP